MPSKKIEDGAEECEEDPLPYSNHQMDHSQGNRDGERRSDGSESVTDLRSGHYGPSTGHGGGAHQHLHGMSAMFATITVATCHCGAGCVLGDMIGTG